MCTRVPNISTAHTDEFEMLPLFFFQTVNKWAPNLHISHSIHHNPQKKHIYNTTHTRRIAENFSMYHLI